MQKLILLSLISLLTITGITLTLKDQTENFVSLNKQNDRELIPNKPFKIKLFQQELVLTRDIQSSYQHEVYLLKDLETQNINQEFVMEEHPSKKGLFKFVMYLEDGKRQALAASDNQNDHNIYLYSDDDKDESYPNIYWYIQQNYATYRLENSITYRKYSYICGDKLVTLDQTFNLGQECFFVPQYSDEV